MLSPYKETFEPSSSHLLTSLLVFFLTIFATLPLTSSALLFYLFHISMCLLPGFILWRLTLFVLYISKPSFSPFILDSLFSRHRTADLYVFLSEVASTEWNWQKMMSLGEVHLVGVHTDKIPLPGGALFTQAICHCQLVENVQVGSLAICKTDKIAHPLERVSLHPSRDNLATPDQSFLAVGLQIS